MKEFDRFGTDFEEYKNTPGAEYRGSIFRDCFGRELETHQCEYCGKTKPVKVWDGIENGRDSYDILMVEYEQKNGRTIWRCNQCSSDIKNTHFPKK